jgi:hypothetical protein
MTLAVRARHLVLGLAAAAALVVGASDARADVPGPITTRVNAILATAGSGTTGMYVKEVGGPVIAASNETFAFEPASSLKVLLHLYAHTQLQSAAETPTTQVQAFPGAATSCPNGASSGTEDLTVSLGKMMRVSDNPATRAQFEFWTATVINNYATALGLGQTSFVNYIGCDVGMSTIDDNTTSLTDLGIIYESVEDGSEISGATRTSFYTLMSGREQQESFGGDFTGIWPILLTMSNTEKPAGMPAALLQDFQDGMTAHHKGGSYARCSGMNCVNRTEWLSWAGSATFPTCESGSFSSRSYVWGTFIHGSVDTSWNGVTSPANTAFLNVRAEPLREQLRAALAGFGACYPPDVTVTTTPAAPPAGQAGYFNAADLAANGGGITVNVSATDDSGVTSLLCTDNGNPVAVGNQSGSNPRTGSFQLTADGAHHVVCTATDGMTPANTGASSGSANTADVSIDATGPTVACGPTPVYVLHGPGGLVSASVSDVLSGPVSTSVSGPADVSTAGAKSLPLTGEDNAGNTTTVACPYVVAYQFLGFFEPVPYAHSKAGSTIPLKFAFGDANGVPIPDAEAAALATSCSVRVFFTGGDPVPACASYNAGANRFEFKLKTPKGISGPHVVTVRIFDGAVVLNSESTNVLMT